MGDPGVDYMNTATSTIESCIRVTKTWVGRYYDRSGGTSPKCLDLAEATSLHSNDLAIGMFFQYQATDYSWFTYASGQTDGSHAKARAQAAGQPSSKPIFFAIDYDASSADLFANITEYFNGIYDTMAGAFPVGVYGSYRVIEHAAANWPGVPWRWQTYAWSGGQVSFYNHLYQHLNTQQLCGIEVDLNDLSFASAVW